MAQDFDDGSRTCVECDAPFIIYHHDRQFFERKGLELPARCKPCRDRRRRDGLSGHQHSPGRSGDRA